MSLCSDVPKALYCKLCMSFLNITNIWSCLDAEMSGATILMQPSSNPGMKSFTFIGTRGQIQEALRIITNHTGQKVSFRCFCCMLLKTLYVSPTHLSANTHMLRPKPEIVQSGKYRAKMEMANVAV